MSENGEDGSEEVEGEPGLKGQLEEEKRRSGDLLSRLKYAQADAENYRKRAEREAREQAEASVRGLAEKLLSVADELDLAVRHSETKGAARELGEGLEMVKGRLMAALESAGVERIECVGAPFDPAVHEAVEKVHGSGARDTVVEEVRPGFRFRGQVMRPSMVKVELASKSAQEAKVDE